MQLGVCKKPAAVRADKTEVVGYNAAIRPGTVQAGLQNAVIH